MNSDENPIIEYIWQAPAWPDLNWNATLVAPLLEQIAAKAGELRGLRSGLSDADQTMILADELGREAAASYAIEGEIVDPTSISASVAASLNARHRSIVAGGNEPIAELMLDAQTNTDPLDADRLHAWHRLMFEGSNRLKRVGTWRTTEMSVVSGVIGNEKTEFEAPQPEYVGAEMAALLDWIRHVGDVPAAVKAALAHLRFETIHPYEDGNGRIGRALAEQILASSVSFSGTPFSLSRTILARRSAYYDALKFSQRLSTIDLENDPHAIDATDFVLWFLEAIHAALDQARGNARLLTTRNRYFEQWRGQLSERQEMVLRRVFEEGQERLDQGISTKPYARIAGVSNVTAARDLADLAEKGAIRKGEAGGRSTRYRIEI